MNNLSVRTGFFSTPSPCSNYLFTPQATCAVTNPSFSLHAVITTQNICAKPLLPFWAECRSGQPCQGGLWGIVTAVFGFHGAGLCMYLEIWDGKVLQAGNDHTRTSLPISASWCAGGARVSLSSCAELMQKLRNCSEKQRHGAPVSTNQIEIVSSLLLLNCFISHQTPRSVLSHNYEPVATILQHGTGLGCRRAG